MAGPQKGKQPTKGAKQIVEENASTIAFYRNMMLGAAAGYLIITIALFSDSFTASVIILNILTVTIYVACFQIFTYISKATYDKNGALLDSGVDLNMEGGMGEHVKDIVILTSITHVLAIISTYFWLLLLLAPMRGFWLLWINILGPWFFQEAPQEPDADDKKRKKMERQMRRRQ